MTEKHIFLHLVTLLISFDVVSLQGGTGIPLQAVNSMSLQGGNGMPMQSGNSMAMHSGNAMAMQSGNSMPMQSGNSMAMQSGNGMPMQSGNGMSGQGGGGMSMQGGGGMSMQGGSGMAMQGGGGMAMQSGTGTQNDPIIIQPLQMHPHPHMNMQMVPQNMHGMSQMSGVLQGGGAPWGINRAVPANMHMQNDAGMGMGNAQMLQVGGGAMGGAGSPGVQAVPGNQMQAGQTHGMGNMAGQMGNMAADMQQVPGGQFWGHIPQQAQFGAFPYAGSMSGVGADASLGFNALATTAKPAAGAVTTAAPAAGKGAGSTPYPKITYIDKQKFKDGMINWKDVAESMVQIGKVLNWLMKFSYMQ